MWDRQTSRFPVDLMTMSVEKSKQCSTARFEKQNKQRQQQKQQEQKRKEKQQQQQTIKNSHVVFVS